MIYAKKSTFVICSNNHIVATIAKDIYVYDLVHAELFEFWPNQPTPVKGQRFDPVCYCGKPWFNLKTNTLVIK